MNASLSVLISRYNAIFEKELEYLCGCMIVGESHPASEFSHQHEAPSSRRNLRSFATTLENLKLPMLDTHWIDRSGDTVNGCIQMILQYADTVSNGNLFVRDAIMRLVDRYQVETIADASLFPFRLFLENILLVNWREKCTVEMTVWVEHTKRNKLSRNNEQSMAILSTQNNHLLNLTTVKKSVAPTKKKFTKRKTLSHNARLKVKRLRQAISKETSRHATFSNSLSKELTCRTLQQSFYT